MFTSREAISWSKQGEHILAEKCLKVTGIIPKSKDSEITDARFVAYSPDTNQVKIRIDCDYHPFWIECVFTPKGQKLNLKAYGRVETINKTSTTMKTPTITNITDHSFTILIRSVEIPESQFKLDIKIPFDKLKTFLSEYIFLRITKSN